MKIAAPMVGRPAVIAVVGPTAVGKTPLAVQLARRLGGAGRAELVNADSRQVIRGLRVGTCTPRPAELQGVPCHLLELRDPADLFTVADWASRARPLLDGMDAARITAIVVGGTGLYLSAALDGLDLPGGAPDRRDREHRDGLATTPTGLAALVAELRRRDPAGAATLDLANPRRVVRGLELVDACGSLAAGRGRGAERTAVRIGLDAPRALHNALVRGRAERMLRGGSLLEEIDSALRRGVTGAALERCGIGYAEGLMVTDGRLSVDAAVERVVARTLRYAKAQRTWFRRDARIRWLTREGEDLGGLVDSALDALHQDAGAGE